MEPLSALGVAGNVVQFVDFSSKLCFTFAQLYKSASGTTKTTKEIEALTKDFTQSIDRVSQDMLQYQLALDQTTPVGEGSQDIQRIVDGCKELASQLLTQLGKLQPSKRAAWPILLATIKTIWKEKELKDLKDRLSDYRSQLEWHILLSLR